MTEAQTALAKRAVVCKGWRWLPGMLAHFAHDGRYTRVSMPDAWGSSTALPDLTDPATLGCLLALVREAWNDLRGYLHPCSGYGWLCSVNGEHVYGVAEAEALVVALEAAP